MVIFKTCYCRISWILQKVSHFYTQNEVFCKFYDYILPLQLTKKVLPYILLYVPVILSLLLCIVLMKDDSIIGIFYNKKLLSLLSIIIFSSLYLSEEIKQFIVLKFVHRLINLIYIILFCSVLVMLDIVNVEILFSGTLVLRIFLISIFLITFMTKINKIQFEIQNLVAIMLFVSLFALSIFFLNQVLFSFLFIVCSIFEWDGLVFMDNGGPSNSGNNGGNSPGNPNPGNPDPRPPVKIFPTTEDLRSSFHSPWSPCCILQNSISWCIILNGNVGLGYTDQEVNVQVLDKLETIFGIPKDKSLNCFNEEAKQWMDFMRRVDSGVNHNEDSTISIRKNPLEYLILQTEQSLRQATISKLAQLSISYRSYTQNMPNGGSWIITQAMQNDPFHNRNFRN